MIAISYGEFRDPDTQNQTAYHEHRPVDPQVVKVPFYGNNHNPDS